MAMMAMVMVFVQIHGVHVVVWARRVCGVCMCVGMRLCVLDAFVRLCAFVRTFVAWVCRVCRGCLCTRFYVYT